MSSSVSLAEEQIHQLEALLASPQNLPDGYLSNIPREDFTHEAIEYVHKRGLIAIHARNGGTLLLRAI